MHGIVDQDSQPQTKIPGFYHRYQRVLLVSEVFFPDTLIHPGKVAVLPKTDAAAVSGYVVVHAHVRVKKITHVHTVIKIDQNITVAQDQVPWHTQLHPQLPVVFL